MSGFHKEPNRPDGDVPDELSPESLFHACDPLLLDFETTADLPELDKVIGQDRALEALDFGIGMPHEGYNLYVLGSTGLGKRTLVNRLLTEASAGRPVPATGATSMISTRPTAPAAFGCRRGWARRCAATCSR
jgi:hypothetical protein